MVNIRHVKSREIIQDMLTWWYQTCEGVCRHAHGGSVRHGLLPVLVQILTTSRLEEMTHHHGHEHPGHREEPL